MANITGTTSNDLLIGDIQPPDIADVILGLAGADQLFGRSGDDRLEGGIGNDLIRGGADNDLMLGQAGIDYLGAVFGAISSDFSITLEVLVASESGDDVIDGGPDNGYLSGGNGNDRLIAGNAIDFLGEFEVTLRRLDGNPFRNAIVLRGSDPGDDVINAGSGNDYLSGGDGNDRLFGEDGDDVLGAISREFRLSEVDASLGELVPIGASFTGSDAGNDVMSGGDGNDRIVGGEGDDFLRGGPEEDILGEDAEALEPGNDRLAGGTENDVLNGGAGDDWLNGGGDRDVLWGGQGSDRLIAGTEDDRLTGTDLLTLGRNEIDTLTGGSERDIFVLGSRRQGSFYNNGNPGDRGLADYALITDFQLRGGDRLELAGRATQYRIRQSPIPGVRGQAIFFVAGQTAAELIAIVQGNLPLNFSQGFVFV